MILYNVILKVNPGIFDDFCDWMMSVHIPEMMETGQFLKSFVSARRIPEDNNLSILEITLQCKSMDEYETYMQEYSTIMRNRFPSKYDGHYKTSRTVNEVMFSTA